MTEDVFRIIVAVGVILACIAFLVQAGVMAALYFITKGTRSRVEPLVERLEPLVAHAEPTLSSVQKLLSNLEENTPRITQISQDVAAITRSAREQAAHISALLEDANTRAAKRLAQLDATVDHAVGHVEQTGEAMKGAVMKPVREVNAILAGVRAALLTYAQGGRRPSVDHATQDEEMFI